jgi:hypothetical protein
MPSAMPATSVSLTSAAPSCPPARSHLLSLRKHVAGGGHKYPEPVGKSDMAASTEDRGTGCADREVPATHICQGRRKSFKTKQH